MNLTTKALAITVALASLAPNGTALVTPPIIADCVPELDVTQTPWEFDVASSSYASTIYAKGTLCDDSGSGSEVGAKGTGDFQITCSVVVTQKTKDNGWGLNLLFFEIHSRTVATKITADLTCEGTYAVTVVHSGGLGPRTATATLGDAGFRVGRVNDDALPALPQSGGSCQYFDPLVQDCPTVHPGDAAFNGMFTNQIPETVRVCAPYEWRHDLTYLPAIDPLTGTGSACSHTIPVDSADLQL